MALLVKIEYAGANESSFARAAEALGRLAELPISAKHVQRISERLGHERAAQRNQDVQRMKAGDLQRRYLEPPKVAAMHFPGWVLVLDFLHLLVHLYAAAMATYRDQGRRGSFRAWRLYEQLLRAAWAGKVSQVRAVLQKQLDRLGPPPPRASGDHPRKVVSLVLQYVSDNAERMDYPRYRQEGLPVTSTLVESLIKQFNQRVKGTEKSRLRGGAEAILQSRTA